MFRNRRKLDNHQAAKVEHDSTSLSDAIHVNQLRKQKQSPSADDAVISNNSLPIKELIRRKHHYENFRETYHETLLNAEKKQRAPKQGDCAPPHGARNTKETVDQLIKRLSCYEGDTLQLFKKTGLTQAPVRTVKTIKVEVPSNTRNAIWCPVPSKNSITTELRSTDTIKSFSHGNREKKSILKKLLDLEDDIQPSKQTEQSDLMQEIQEANIQVDVASQQLQHIHNLIQGRKLTPVTEEEEERDVETPEPKLNSKTDVNKTPSIRWNTRDKYTNKHNTTGDKTKKLVNTLNTLNKRLEMMQEKMLQSRSSYKSIKDYLSVAPKEKQIDPLDMLFKNNKYPKMKSILKCPQNTAVDMELTDVLNEMLETFVKPDKECRKAVESPHPLSPKVSPKTAPEKIIATEGPVKKICVSPKQFLKKNTRNVDFFLTPNYTEENVVSQFNLIDKKLKHRLVVTRENSDKEDYEDSTGFSRAMQETIQKSDYLRKEFDAYCKKQRRKPKQGQHIHFGNVRPSSAARRY